ncbi:MAG: pyridoxamine 5'-phosphate oxidase family protein [Candidatus Eremiobacteraeota bacterium]|nr:pyridoxamine 5'-phosphate oxidase family protein [Candidatus Eremiobacteraeota bacterium]
MVGELTADAIESLLHSEIVARIAYVDRRGLPNIVPITYAYDGRCLYGYSLLGAKMEFMSANPQVCIAIDRIESAADWRSVTARGEFQALQGEAAEQAVERISDRLRTYGAATNAPVPAWKTFVARSGGAGLAYRIVLSAKQGRYSASA